MALTPAGLWAGPRSTEPPSATWTRTAGADTVAIELGAPRRALDDALWPSLDRLFGELEPEVRERAVVHVHGVLGSKGVQRLRRLTVRHNFSLMPLTPDETGAAAETEGGAARSVVSAPSAEESFPSLGRASAVRTPQAQGPRTDEDADVDGTEGAAEVEKTPDTSATGGPTYPDLATIAQTPAPARELPTQTRAEPVPTPSETVVEAGVGVRSEEQVSPLAGHLSSATASKLAPGTASSQPGTASTPVPPASEATASEIPDPTPEQGIPAPATATAETSPPSPTGTGALSGPLGRGTARPRGADTSPGAGAGAGAGTGSGASGPDHVTLRGLLGPYWEQHRAAVPEIMECLFSGEERELSDAMTAELVAVHVYMTAVDEAQLRVSLAEGHDQGRTLLRCLRSGMRRLPTYRGAAMSTAQELVSRLAPDAVGEEWEATVPVRAVSTAQPYPGASVDHVLIWSVTGRRTGTGADEVGQDILFARESRFRVLGVVRHGAATVGLLQEMPPQAHNPSAQLDAALLKRLRSMLDLPSAEPGAGADPPAPRPGTAQFPNPVA
ncbi:hypothetical protein [Streptomyces sp. NPDC005799]|uniref:hypothetical protein n=1 Tax=Streptomyces sp. NPDC005799 TaxID=3154678 RepID=UPI0033E90020